MAPWPPPLDPPLGEATINVLIIMWEKICIKIGTQDTPDETSYEYCLKCDFVCKPRRILRQHIYVKYVVKIKCKDCNLIFTTMIDLEEHITTVYDLTVKKSKVEFTFIYINNHTLNPHKIYHILWTRKSCMWILLKNLHKIGD